MEPRKIIGLDVSILYAEFFVFNVSIRREVRITTIGVVKTE